MRSALKILLFFIALAPVLSNAAFDDKISLGPYIQFIEDETHQLTFEDILSKNKPANWYYSYESVANFGFSDSTFWIKVEIDPARVGAGSKILELAYPLMDYVELYQPQDSGNGYRKIITGDSFVFDSRPIDHRNFAFQLNIPEEDKFHIYLKLNTRDTMIVPLALWSEEAFYDHYDTESYWLGVYYGAILSIVIYCLLCWVVLKTNVFILNVISITCFCLIQLSLDGVGTVHIWGDFPEFAKRIRPFAISVLAISAQELTRAYFERKSLYPEYKPLYWFTYSLSLMGMLGAIVLPFSLSIQFSMINILIALVPVILTGVIELRKGSMIAKYFASGWAFLVLGGIANVLRGFGVLPVNVFTVYSAQIGALATMLLLTFGFTDRIRVLQNKVELAHKRALEREKEANKALDEKVKKRTLDLEKSHQVILQKNKAFEILLETATLMDHKENLQSLLELLVSQLVRVFPENKFALLLDESALEEHVKPIFHDVHILQQKSLMRYHEHLIKYDENKRESRAQEDGSLFDDLNVVPIRKGDNLLMGHVIMIGEALSQSDKELLMVFVGQLTSFLKNKVLHDQLELLANRDALTGVYSRAYFDNQLFKLSQEKQNNDADYAVILIDVNGLKAINDNYGHNYGDEMIKIVADFLQEHVRGNDVVCRLGGDEFVVLAKGSGKQIVVLINKLNQEQNYLKLNIDSHNKTMPVRFSIGWASSSDSSCKDLLKIADEQMYESKNRYYRDNPQLVSRRQN